MNKLVKYKPQRRSNFLNKAPYNILDLYKLLNNYDQRYKKHAPYDSRSALRRGYNPRLYSPSRKRPYSSTPYRYNPRTATYRPRIHSQPQPPYRIQPKPHSVRSNSNPQTRPPRYKLHNIRYQPNVEKMLKQLEHRFDEKLEEDILWRLETEFRELKEALREKSEADKDPQGPTERIEASNEENEPQQGNTGATSFTSLNIPDFESESGTKDVEIPEMELQNDNGLYGIGDGFGWLEELMGETALPGINEHEIFESNPEPTMDDGLETVKEPVELSQPLDQTEPIEHLPEAMDPLAQSDDLEPLFDQIEPLDTELVPPIEQMVMPEILPELADEVLEDAMEAGAY